MARAKSLYGGGRIDPRHRLGLALDRDRDSYRRNLAAGGSRI